MENKPNKKRCVIVFEDDVEYEEFKSYARYKALDLKNLFKSVVKSHMIKYPQKQGIKSNNE